MSTIDFDQIYKDLQSGVVTVAEDSLKDYVGQAKKDGQLAISKLKDNLSLWAVEVETGAMSKEDLEFLLQGEEALSEMEALKQAGLAAIEIDKFKNALINMILGTVTGLIKV